MTVRLLAFSLFITGFLGVASVAGAGGFDFEISSARPKQIKTMCLNSLSQYYRSEIQRYKVNPVEALVSGNWSYSLMAKLKNGLYCYCYSGPGGTTMSRTLKGACSQDLVDLPAQSNDQSTSTVRPHHALDLLD